MPPGDSVPRQRHVALIIETSKTYGREILLGISKYMRLHGAWSNFITERGQDDPDPLWLRSWSGDGIITRSLDMSLCRAAQKRGVSVVSLRHLLAEPAFPTLFPDQRLIAERVAQHFVDAGLQHFAYVGIPQDEGWELLRRRSFRHFLEQKGHSSIHVRSALTLPSRGWEDEEEQITAWIKTLPTPVGIMVNHDTQGVQLLNACRRAGVRVPDEISVVSVDNDPVLCEIAAVPLSSLDQNVQTLGFKAATLLDRMMKGEKVERKNYFTEPGEVVVRQSSDILAIDDEPLARAIRYVRENACKDINVPSIVRVAKISRRMLEKKFIDRLGRTPLEEIQEIRFRRIRQLLLETDYTLPQIAKNAGFSYQEYMVRFFKKKTEMTPGEYRRKLRFDA